LTARRQVWVKRRMPRLAASSLAQTTASPVATLPAASVPPMGLRAENAALRRDLAAVHAENATLRAEAAELRARLAEAERRLALHSGNSGKPPSSDGLKKRPARVRSLRRRSGRKSGGQPGHLGATLQPVATPDEVVDHVPPACADCGAALSLAMSTDHAARQVLDLPPPPPLQVTEHRAHLCQCADCGARTRAKFPSDVTAPVQYGARIAAFVVYLLHVQFLPEQRVAAAMAALFGVALSPATVARMSRDCARRFAAFVAEVRRLIAAAAVKHLDETGLRVGGKLRWLHIAATTRLTDYRIGGRGELPVGLKNIVVHDHWKPYFRLPNVLHALCNQHHLRELQALIEIEQEDWARRVQRLLRRACHATNLARQHNKPLPPRLIASFERAYDAILADAIAFHEEQPPLPAKRRGRPPRRTGHNLAVRLRDFRTEVLRFLHDPTVPFTNNTGEHAARMAKLRQKISGGFRSLQGALDFAVIRSVLSTAQKQEWDLLEVLASDPKELIARLKVG
jgi:transposase